MSNLTPEEKRKIYEEEKTRLEAQDTLKKEKKKKEAKQAQIGCLILVAIVAIVAIYYALKPSSPGSKEPQKPLYYQLNASVRFDGTQFIISNNEDFDWTNVKLEINAGLFSGGYVYNAPILKSKMTYKVGALQFAKSGGERFNPFAIKAQNIDIWCDTPRGQATYHGQWN